MFFFFDTTSIKEVKNDTGVLVKLMRKEAGLSQEQLAEELGISRFTVRNMENGKNITLETLLKVFQRFESLEKFQKFIKDDIADHSVKSLY